MEDKDMSNEEMRARVQVFLMKEKIKDLKRQQRDMELRYAIREAHEHQRELEERYNHYHDPHNGRFASGAGGGEGLYYSMGKGKGAIVGASSSLDSEEAYKNKLMFLKAKREELSNQALKAVTAPFGSTEHKSVDYLLSQIDVITTQEKTIKEKLGLIPPPVMSNEEAAAFVKHYKEVSENFEKKNKPYK